MSSAPPQYRPIGIALAVSSGALIGSSFVFKKKGLLSSQKGKVAGEGVAYLKSPMWWTGMTIMIFGELCNFTAYAFVEAIIVTPLGALSVVICALLSHFILKEKLTLFGWIGSIQCILGASILALNAPQQQSVSDIASFKKLFLAPGFLSYGSVVIAVVVFLAAFVAPRWGTKTMMPYIGVCSLIGGLSVSCTQGLGACILTSIRGENQFKNWFIYFVLIFVVFTLLTEVYYLNVALAMYNTAMVTPTYYVTFTFCTLLTSIILYQGLKASGQIIVTVVLGFLVICTGITILQMSKIDPRKLISPIDDKTALLLEVTKQEVDRRSLRDVERSATVTSRPSRGTLNSRHARTGSTQSKPGPAPTVLSSNGSTRSTQPTQPAQPSQLPQQEELVSPFYATDGECSEDDERAIVEKIEEPGLDSLRGSFGAIGTIIRANRRARALSEAQARRRPSTTHAPSELSGRGIGPVSPRTSITSGTREQNGAESNLEKTDLRQQFFGGSKRSIKTSAASQEPLVALPPSVLRRPSTPSRVALSSEGLARPPLFESPPSSPELLRSLNLHAHFDGSDTLSRSRTSPTVIPSMTEEKKNTL